MYEFHIVSLHKLQLHLQVHHSLRKVMRQLRFELSEIDLILDFLPLLFTPFLLEDSKHAK